jgi:hypothetical protein
MPGHPRRPPCAATVLLPALVAAVRLAVFTAPARAQDDLPIKGEAALAHPAVQLAVKGRRTDQGREDRRGDGARFQA